MLTPYSFKALSYRVVLVAALGFAVPACGGGESDDDNTGGKGGSGGGGGSELGKRKVENCKYATVAEVETNIIAKSCATAGCHRDDSVPGGDLRAKMGTSFAEAALDRKTTDQCKDQPFFDKEDPENSMFYRVLQDNPKCKDGSTILRKMPPSNALRMLLEGEKQCLEEYVKAVTKKD